MTAELWAEGMYEGASDIDVGTPESFSANGLDGHEVTAEIDARSRECYPETAMVRVVSVEAPGR
ncbi:hypothetical protein [Halostreptopolyspora alba]|uniref:Uncharacterized protein n=1 Tax=Halostreptopolyspora alba TaxID=2487137 RepID=A0A3N0DYG5_9ACTN|nr:hypothetical protein EFW17_22765 [Nocardiopsaceae bacterium YIM 96095]